MTCTPSMSRARAVCCWPRSAPGWTRIVYTSSVATLRLAGDGTVADENSIATVADMIGHYKRSKFLGEQVVQQWATRRARATAGW